MSIVDLEFEWDENKNSLNIKNHRIRFALAAKVFEDPYRIEMYDDSHSSNEDRYITIGAAGKILCVIYTQRINHIRIISARLATRWEEEAYWHGHD